MLSFQATLIFAPALMVAIFLQGINALFAINECLRACDYYSYGMFITQCQECADGVPTNYETCFVAWTTELSNTNRYTIERICERCRSKRRYMTLFCQEHCSNRRFVPVRFTRLCNACQELHDEDLHFRY